MTMDINLPEVQAEVSAVFARYEDALVNNHVDVLDELFWASPHTVRYGVGENLYGIEAIRAFRTRAAVGRPGAHAAAHRDHHLRPRLRHRDDRVPPRRRRRAGRQSQTWCRIAGGWRVVAAHVSLLPEPPDSSPTLKERERP